jgi:hypothetical protein
MEKSFTFTLTAQEVDVIGQALAELPFKMAAPVINKLREQVQTSYSAGETAGAAVNGDASNSGEVKAVKKRGRPAATDTTGNLDLQ